MSLFIAGLAFPGDANLELAKIGVLLGSALAGLVGYVILRSITGAAKRETDAPNIP